jgi:branched-chain amino acid transport system substrate-binding protein
MHASPIRIGYCLSLTGPLAGNGQSARLAHEIWREDVNQSGGLLGRPVELICYDDGRRPRAWRGSTGACSTMSRST